MEGCIARPDSLATSFFRYSDLEGHTRVELSAGIQASLAGRYASALFDLASEAGTVTAVESDLDTLDAAANRQTSQRLLPTPKSAGRSCLPSWQVLPIILAFRR